MSVAPMPTSAPRTPTRTRAVKDAKLTRSEQSTLPHVDRTANEIAGIASDGLARIAAVDWATDWSRQRSPVWHDAIEQVSKALTEYIFGVGVNQALMASTIQHLANYPRAARTHGKRVATGYHAIHGPLYRIWPGWSPVGPTSAQIAEVTAALTELSDPTYIRAIYRRRFADVPAEITRTPDDEPALSNLEPAPAICAARSRTRSAGWPRSTATACASN